MKSLFFILIFSANILANDWQVNKNVENNVVFKSTTNLLDFQGVTNNIDGYIYWDGDTVFGDNNEIFFEVELATFKTGIGKRDSDMRKDVLHTDKFPKAAFKGKFIKVEKTASNFSVIVKGEISLHGHKKEIEIPGIITLKDKVLNIKSNFSLFLKDYKIIAPSLVAFIKVAEEIKLELDFNLKEAK